MQYVTAGLSAIDDLIAIDDAAAVDGMHHGGLHTANHVLSAAFVHGAAVFHPLRFQPVAGFEDGDDLLRRELLRQRDRVMDVIEVTMRYQDRVDAVELVVEREIR